MHTLNDALRLPREDISRFPEDAAVQASLQEIFAAYVEALYSLASNFETLASMYVASSSIIWNCI
jgi:hypothetical protein